jgi:hypothetical protein
LAVSACRLHAKYPIHATRDSPTTVIFISMGLSPSMAQLSRSLRLHITVDIGGPHTTFPTHRWEDSVCSWSRFTRCYSGNRNCFLFLRLLRCFTSAGSFTFRYYTTYWSVLGSPIRKSPGLSLHAAHRSVSPLVTSFFSTSNLVIHCTA